MFNQPPIVIYGITRSGRKFRPSDWAQRLTTAVASSGPGRHIRFHPQVRMATLDGINCVVIARQLAQQEPQLFQFLLRFGEDNQLRIDGLESTAATTTIDPALEGALIHATL